MSITIKDVAREAGVSFSTVSKVINNSPEISSATAEKVKKVMQDMDFTPNARAANFKRRSTHNIAFLASLKKGTAFLNPHMFEIFCGAHHTLAQKKYSITLVDISEEAKAGETLKYIMNSSSYDGVIIHGSALNTDSASMLTRSSFPYIVIGKPTFKSQISWLDTNNVLAGAIASRHLFDGGAQNISFIGGQEDERISKDRLDGAKMAMSEIGMSIKKEHIAYTDSTISSAYHSTLKMLQTFKNIDGIICENNMIAFGALNAIHDLHLNLPDDLQIITFDDYPFSQIMSPSPTVVNIDVYDLGKQAASQLLKNIRNPALHVQSYITLPELIIRNTTKI